MCRIEAVSTPVTISVVQTRKQQRCHSSVFRKRACVARTTLREGAAQHLFAVVSSEAPAMGFGVSSGILAAVDEHSGRSRSCSGPKRWSDCAVVSSGVVEFVVSDDKATTSTAIQAPRSPKADIHFPPTMIIVILWSGCSPK